MIKKITIFHILLLLVSNIYGINDKIYSVGSSSANTLAHFLQQGNNELGDELVNEFATIYIEEATLEGINWDVAFVQMCLETGFLRYGGLVNYGQNNFCGLGSFDNKQGASFSTIREGVRAHIQHLKAYSSTEELKGLLLDPRFHLVKRGSAKRVLDLSGKWATDPKYGSKILSLLSRIKKIETVDSVLRAEVPMGFEAVTTTTIMEVSENIDTVSIVSKNIKLKENVPNNEKKNDKKYVIVIGGGWVR